MASPKTGLRAVVDIEQRINGYYDAEVEIRSNGSYRCNLYFDAALLRLQTRGGCESFVRGLLADMAITDIEVKS